MNDNDRFKTMLKKQRAEEAKELEAAKERAKVDGKEPFCLDAFYATYTPSAPPSKRPREEQFREWEKQYYLSRFKVKTIEEFARAVELSDLYDGGDMHLE